MAGKGRTLFARVEAGGREAARGTGGEPPLTLGTCGFTLPGVDLVLEIAVFFAFVWLSILWHEIGHLAAALLMGWRPIFLRMGHGRIMARLRVRGLEIQLGQVPTSGMVQSTPRRLVGFRARYLVFVAGGPLATAALVAFLVWLVFDPRTPLPDSLSQLGVFLLAYEGFALLNTLLPRMVWLGKLYTPNDGLLLWRMLWMKEPVFTGTMVGYAFIHATWLAEQGRPVEGEQELKWELARLSKLPPSAALYLRLHWLAQQQLEARALDLWNECEEQVLKVTTGRTQALDALACFPFYYGHPRFLERALRLIEQAVAEEPETLTLQGTQGSILLELGRREEAEVLLQRVAAKSKSETDQAICEFYLALACAQRGELAEAEQRWQAAFSKYPKCQVASRVQQLIKERRQ